jgi:hypothetical protein
MGKLFGKNENKAQGARYKAQEQGTRIKTQERDKVQGTRTRHKDKVQGTRYKAQEQGTRIKKQERHKDKAQGPGPKKGTRDNRQ